MKLFCHALCALLFASLAAHAVPLTIRVVNADDKPVAGATVEYVDYADITDEKPNVAQFVTTAVDGTIALDLRGASGRVGEVVFQSGGKNVLGSARVRDAKLGYGVAALFAGENTLTLQTGVRVSGVIQDATGVPVPGASVRFVRAEKDERDYSDLRAQFGLPPIVTATNVGGRWEIANLPRGYASFIVSAPGYAHDKLEFWIDKSEMTAPELKLRAAGVVRGRILDFDGRPLDAIDVYMEDEYGSYTKSDAQGRFELSGVPVGETALGFSRYGFNWTGVSREVKAKIPDQNAIVDIGDVRADEGLLLTGTIVDSITKAPIAGVKLELLANRAILQTDAQGRLDTRIQKPYYGFSVVGNITEKSVMSNGEQTGDKFDVGTIEVERLGATFTGRVTDANGAVIAGVRVGWNRADRYETVAPDVRGNFKIENLPFKPLVISASDGTRYAEITATPGAPVDLKLPPATALSDAEIEKLWDELRLRRISDLGRTTQALGARRVFETARRFDAKTDPTQIGQGLDDYLSDRARGARTPAERGDIAREGVELLRRFDAGTWSLGMGEIAVLAARTDDAELRAWAAKWYDAQKTQVRKPDSPDKLEWYHSALTERVMQVGAALNRDDATAYRDIWLGQIDKPNSKNSEYDLVYWGESLWLAEPKWFDEIVGQWPASEQMRAILGALKVEQDAAQAKALLARLETLASDPAIAVADAEAAKSNSMSPISESASNLYEGRTNYARSMALIDAPAALDALDKVQAVIQSGETYQIAAIIARAAIADGRGDIARRALRLGLRDRDAEGSGALALVARPFDAELAAQLMEKARVSAMPNNGPFEIAGRADVAAYAFALREFDAGVGRLLLEDQWAKRQQPPGKPRFDEESERRDLIRQQEKLAWAMSVYDTERALQWLSEIKDDRNEYNNGIERTRLAILVAALTPPERRSFLLGATDFNLLGIIPRSLLRI